MGLRLVKPRFHLLCATVPDVDVFIEVPYEDGLVSLPLHVEPDLEVVNRDHGYGVLGGDKSTGTKPSCAISSASTATEFCIALSSGPTHFAARPA